MHQTLLLFLVAALLTAGCASPKAPERPPLSEDEKIVLRDYWNAYLRHDPSWPEARGKWIQLSEAAQNTLVENLIRAMSDQFLNNNLLEARRAAAELVLLDKRSVEYLAAVLGSEGNAMGVREMAASCLRSIGTPAVPSLLGCLDSHRYQARRLAVRALGWIRDPRAVAPLARLLAEDENFAVRKEAANALGVFDGNEVASRALRRCVAEEEDVIVVEEAVRSLGRLKQADSVRLLVERLRRTEREGTSVGLKRTIRKELSRITGLDAESNYAAFLNWKPAS
jgi:HEAT repeat protein